MAADIPQVNLAQLIDTQSASYPDHIALVVADQSYTYQQLSLKARQCASLLKNNNIQRLGIFASRSVAAYIGILAAQWLGITYVPLNPALPMLRNKNIARMANLDGLIVDEATLPLIADLGSDRQIMPVFQQDQIDKENELLSGPDSPAVTDIAYLMFTSGSTGEPKGVPISYGNLSSFIAAINQRYQIDETDRVSQFSALTFDVSIFDMILAWQNGAALHVIPESELLAPASFLHDHAITVWLGVPSVISFMHKLKMLISNYFTSLKYSIFTGEALLMQQVEVWRVAASNSQIENLYGPTEATIDCLGQIIDKETQYYRDAVPIGRPFANVFAALINDKDEFLPLNQRGQLVIAGAQVAAGYWQNVELTAQKFKKLQHPQHDVQQWYLTGDYCFQDEAGVFYYLGRLDNQCKILGNRIELEEIEYHLKKIYPGHEAIADISGSGVDALIVVVSNISELNESETREQLKRKLPFYMLPTKYIYKKDFYYNSNGKLDRKLLKAWIAEQVAKIS